MKKVFIDLWLIMMSLTCQPVTTLSQRCHIGYICHENNEKKYLVLGMGISHTQEGLTNVRYILTSSLLLVWLYGCEDFQPHDMFAMPNNVSCLA